MARSVYDIKIASLGKIYGPLAPEKLVELASQGRLTSQDLVRVRGTDQWQPVTSLPAVAAAMPQATEVPLAPGEEAAAAEMDDLPPGSWTMPKSHDSELAELDMTPMIDVTFQLLIFFMLSNSLANPTPMEVPEAVHGRGVTLEGQQLVLIDQDGSYYLGSEPRPENRAESLDSLITEVRTNASAVEGSMDVIISAHKKTKYLPIRELVERLGKVEGLGRLMLGVEEQLR